MTLLTLVNQAQDKLSLPRSSVVISSTDQAVRTLLALANEEGKELNRRVWTATTKEKTFTSVAQASQTGAIPADFDAIVNETFFNRTNHRRVTGPLSAEEWQYQQSITANLLTDSFRFRGNAILINPTPTAGLTYAYEYVSKYWVDTNADGVAEAAAWAADGDTSLLSEDLMILGLQWRWRKDKGFDYAEEMNSYEMQVAQAQMRDGGKRIVSFAGDVDRLYDHARPPAIPDGNWNL